jgi:probable F420-dependent oxidoreductase
MTRTRLAVSLSHIDRLGRAGQAGLLSLAVAAEEAGVDQVVLSEHVVLAAEITGHPGARPGEVATRFPFPSNEDYPEPLVALAAIGAITSRVRLSTNVLLAPLRPAVLLAKMAATVDVLSGGRLELGVGTGWHTEEFKAVGVPFEGVGARLEDTVRACQMLWRGGPSSFSSPTVSFTDVYCSPTPVQRGGIPIWFGGTARRAVARRIAELGHGWSPIGNTPPEDVLRGSELIRSHCERINRDAAGIAIRCSLPAVRRNDGRGDLAATIGGAKPFVAAGATIVQLPPVQLFVDNAADVGPLLTEAVETLQRLSY